MIERIIRWSAANRLIVLLAAAFITALGLYAVSRTPLDAIPYERMWQDDIYWLPAMIEGRKFVGKFVFDGDRMLWKSVEIAQDIRPCSCETIDADCAGIFIDPAADIEDAHCFAGTVRHVFSVSTGEALAL